MNAASKLGFQFTNRSPNSVEVMETVNGITLKKTYRVLHVLEFNSTRKRMSVVVQDDKGKIIVFCKGADNVIYERLHATVQGTPAANIQEKIGTLFWQEFGL